MKDIFEVIERVFGATTLQVVAGGVVLYFGLLGLFKLAESIRSVSQGKRALEHERTTLELLKLRYEIEAIRKTNALPELAVQELATVAIHQQTQGVSAVASTGTLWAVWRYIIFPPLLSIGTASGLFLLPIARYALRHRLSAAEWGMSIAAVIIAVGFLYLALRKIGPWVRARSAMAFHVSWIASVIAACGLVVYAWFQQSV